MSVDVGHRVLQADIHEILNSRLDFSAPDRYDFKEDIPRNYKILLPTRQGTSSFGSPCTSHGDRGVSCLSSAYESSTASSSPLSITKELTNVSSPLTPCVARSKSKSPSTDATTPTFLSEKSKSPSVQLKSDISPLCDANHNETLQSSDKKKKKKEKRKSLAENGNSPSVSPSENGFPSTTVKKLQDSLNTKKTITFKLGNQVTGKVDLPKPALVAYEGSDDSENEDAEEQAETSMSKVKKEAERIIGPLKPSSDPLPPVKKEERKETFKAMVEDREKRKSTNNGDPPAVKRKRLLSERGEKELAYPVMDNSTISIFNWKDCTMIKNRQRGVGLLNSSNDCFLNAVLQIVTHTAPLARYIMEKHQPNQCSRPMNQCLCCAMKNMHFKKMFGGPCGPFFASWIRPHLKRIFPSHIHGMQEDAHELLTLLLDAFDPPPTKSNGIPNGINSKPSTPIEQIFGGTLRNQITCTTCHSSYINYERIRELNLAIRKNGECQTRIANLLDNYFRDENVSNFDCKKCGKKTLANRRTRVLRPPAVLLVQLKRFNAFGGKIRLPVNPDMEVDMMRFLFDSSSPASSAQYVLTSVVEHLGAGVDHGHYVALVRGFDHKQWFLFDDEQISPINVNKISETVPYLLVYSRKSDMGVMATRNGDNKPMGIGMNHVNKQNGIRNNNDYYHRNGYTHNPNMTPKNGYRIQHYI